MLIWLILTAHMHIELCLSCGHDYRILRYILYCSVAWKKAYTGLEPFLFWHGFACVRVTIAMGYIPLEIIRDNSGDCIKIFKKSIFLTATIVAAEQEVHKYITVAVSSLFSYRAFPCNLWNGISTETVHRL